VDVIKAVTYFNEIGPIKRREKNRQVRIKDVWRFSPMGFFDGACEKRKCGCGAFIIIKPGFYYHFWWEGGKDTNNRAEVIALWGVLSAAKWLGFE